MATATATMPMNPPFIWPHCGRVLIGARTGLNTHAQVKCDDDDDVDDDDDSDDADLAVSILTFVL